MFGELLTNTDHDASHVTSDETPHYSSNTQTDSDSQAAAVYDSLLADADFQRMQTQKKNTRLRTSFTHFANCFGVQHIQASSSQKFDGAFIDTDVAQSVIVEVQTRAYCRESGCTYSLKPSNVLFQLVIGFQKSRGSLSIRIPVAAFFLDLSLYVVPVDLPLLKGLDIIYRYLITVDAPRYKLTAADGSWTVKLNRKILHLYYAWSVSNLLYTRTKLVKMHKHYHHTRVIE